MVTEREINEAIAELEAAPSSLRNCEKIVVLQAMKKIYFEGETQEARAVSAAPQSQPIHTSGESEFLKAVEGKSWEEVLPHIDELSTAVKALQPQLYDVFMRRF